MSGIVGLFDPVGAEPSHLRRAARAAQYRGEVHVRSFGRIALGCYVNKVGASQFVERAGSALVADARIDAALPGSVSARLAVRHSGVELLAAVLDEEGPQGLDGLAADFALARWDLEGEELLLARDAFGLRPLYWAQAGDRLGFAPEPSVLLALGLASGDLDVGVVSLRLAGVDPAGERTAFAGISRVPGGRWVTFKGSQGRRIDRWFKPELVPVEDLTLHEASEVVREAVVESVTARSHGQSLGISLSGGRDSAAVAIASQLAGVRATCITLRFEPDSVPPEGAAARAMAHSAGHDWREAVIDTSVTVNDLLAIPNLAGSPVGFPSFPGAVGRRNAFQREGVGVVLDGEGGDPLFAAPPLSILDVVRSGRFRASVRAGRAYRRQTGHSYGPILKSVLRGAAPMRLIAFRDRYRRTPPWSAAPKTLGPLSGVRSSREMLVRFLRYLGGSDFLEMSEQLFQRAGIRYACPLYDQRVVRAALALPVDLRQPLPSLKPVLSAAFLGRSQGTRVKAVQTPFFRQLARDLQRDFPWLFDSATLCAQRGFVRGSAACGADSPWLVDSLEIVPTEMWLRRMEG